MNFTDDRGRQATCGRGVVTPTICGRIDHAGADGFQYDITLATAFGQDAEFPIADGKAVKFDFYAVTGRATNQLSETRAPPDCRRPIVHCRDRDWFGAPGPWPRHGPTAPWKPGLPHYGRAAMRLRNLQG